MTGGYHADYGNITKDIDPCHAWRVDCVGSKQALTLAIYDPLRRGEGGLLLAKFGGCPTDTK